MAATTWETMVVNGCCEGGHNFWKITFCVKVYPLDFCDCKRFEEIRLGTVISFVY